MRIGNDTRWWAAGVQPWIILLILCRPAIDDLPECGVLSVNADQPRQNGQDHWRTGKRTSNLEQAHTRPLVAKSSAEGGLSAPARG